MFKNWLKKFRSNDPTVAIIKLHGVIEASSSNGLKKSSLSIHSLKKEIDKAFNTPKVTAIAISVNSPGGTPVQAELIYKYIRMLANQRKVPVYSFIEDVAASGGYWLSCCGDEIYASESSIVGSIGVISAGFGFVKALNKLGLERRILTQGKNKSIYDPFLPTKQEDKKIILDIQSDIHKHFRDIILAHRKDKLSPKHEELFNGKFWSGAKSLELGLIDGIGDLYSTMQAKYGDEICFKCFDKEESWIQKKLGLAGIFSGLLNSLISKIEEKAALSKFGL